GWIGQDGTNSYNGIPASDDGGLNGGKGSVALGQITGWATSTGSGFFSLNPAVVEAVVQSGRAVVVSTPKSGVNVPELVGRHEYTLFAADDTGVVVAN